MATAAPSAASRFAIAAPMLREPPVTRATLPARFLEFIFIDVGFVSFSGDKSKRSTDEIGPYLPERQSHSIRLTPLC
jgi:hypothetical protein